MYLSIVVPLYNEEKSVPLLYQALTKALARFGQDIEMIFVDDGSRDGTYEALRALADTDERIRLIKFRRNFGQTPAMAAGIDHSVGDVIVTLDGDLQNDPEDIPRLAQQIDAGYDLAVGWRYNRQDTMLTRKLPSMVANWLISKITRVPIKDNGCSLKAYRGSVIKRVPLYSELHRFIPAMASMTGARIAEIKVRHHARQLGESKYGLSRIYKVLLDVTSVKTLISFSSKPLLWFSMLALPPALFAIAILTYTLYVATISNASVHIPLAGTGVLCGTLSIIIFFTGILGELVYKSGDAQLPKFAFLTANVDPFTWETHADSRSADDD